MAVREGRGVFFGRAGGMLVVQDEDGFTPVEMPGQKGEIVVGNMAWGDLDAQGGEPLSGGPDRFDACFQRTSGAPHVPVPMARGD